MNILKQARSRLILALALLTCCPLIHAQPPIATIFYHGAAYCAQMRLLIPMAPPICFQNVDVDIRTSNPSVTSFIVILSYTDADGSNARSQILAGPTHTSVGMQVASVWFMQDVTNIANIKAEVLAQVGNGEQAIGYWNGQQ